MATIQRCRSCNGPCQGERCRDCVRALQLHNRRLRAKSAQQCRCMDCGAAVGKNSYGRCHPCAVLLSNRTRIVGPEKKPERQEGDRPSRCLWCLHFRCDGPLQKCADCQEQYLQILGRLNGAEAGSGIREYFMARSAEDLEE